MRQCTWPIYIRLSKCVRTKYIRFSTNMCKDALWLLDSPGQPAYLTCRSPWARHGPLFARPETEDRCPCGPRCLISWSPRHLMLSLFFICLLLIYCFICFFYVSFFYCFCYVCCSIVFQFLFSTHSWSVVKKSVRDYVYEYRKFNHKTCRTERTGNAVSARMLICVCMNTILITKFYVIDFF